MINRLEDIAKKLSGANLPDINFEDYFKAHEDDTAKVKTLIDFYDDIEAYLEHGNVKKGAKLPFAKTHNLFRFRGGEVTLWTGFNGHKKSMLLGFVALGFIKENEKVCIASFEMKPMSTIDRMVKQFSHNKEVSYNEYADFLQAANEKLYIFDQQGGITPDRIFGVIVYCAEHLGIKHFIIDSLMRVIAGEDSYNAQKDFVVKLCEIAIKTNTHIHLVHHTKKGKEDVPSGRYDAKGSGAISDNVHNSLIVWANKDENQNMPNMILKCDKQRSGEWEGKIALTFDPETLRFNEAYTVGNDYD